MFLILILTTHAYSAEPTSRRVITLNPALTEILFAVDLGASIVGTVDASDFPDEAKKILRVGSYGRPNIEKIIELKPDAVVTFKEGIDQISASLDRRKIKLYAYDSRTLGDYEKLVRQIGSDFDRSEQANSLIKKWSDDWASLEVTKNKKSVLLQLESAPVIVAGGDSFLSEILKKCGYTNPFEQSKGYPNVSRETLITKSFETVVVLKEQLSQAEIEAVKKSWTKLRPQNLVFYDPHIISRLGPRLPVEAKRFCKEAGAN